MKKKFNSVCFDTDLYGVICFNLFDFMLENDILEHIKILEENGYEPFELEKDDITKGIYKIGIETDEKELKEKTLFLNIYSSNETETIFSVEEEK